ncbi:MAG: hypothetical protein D6696_07475 [Acidobacteria bacterium]|nr:MAG: hypothetical protein D6696_07475 [Acidobacteriota bacterium]
MSSARPSCYDSTVREREHDRRRRLRGAAGSALRRAAWVAVLAALLACSPRARPTLPQLADLQGQVLASRSGLGVPDHRWRVDGGRWQLDGPAGFAFVTRVVPAADVAVSLTLAEGQAEPELELFFDGQRLPPPGRDAGDERLIVARLPRASLTPGTHVLDLLPAAGEQPLFSELALHVGTFREAFRPSGRSYYSYLADFIALGVAGPAPPPRFGGFLMLGSQRVAVEVPAAAERFVAEVLNASFAPATIALASGDQRLETAVDPGAEVRLELAVDRDRSPQLELAAAGLPEGIFHWRAGRFESPRERRPPLILISLDTTRRDAVPPWSDDPGSTPHLAAFSDVATAFDAASTTAPWTLPAHVSMFTGRYPSQHGAGVFTYGLGPEPAALAQRLAGRGYVTAGFAGGPFTSYLFGLGRGFAVYDESPVAELQADALTDAALAFLDRHGDDPFFLFLNYFDPHFPWRAPRRFDGPALAAARRSAPAGSVLARLLDGDGGAWFELAEGRLAPDAATRALLVAAYRAEVAFMDEQIGRLFAALERRGIFDRALIAVLADHGELLGEGGYFNHGCRLDPELVRIPMLLKRPGQRRPQRLDHPASAIDVFPTFLSAAGLPAPAGDALVLDAGVLARSKRRAVYSEEHELPPLHGLIEHMRIASGLLSVEGRGHRRVLWPEGAYCQRLADGGWRTESCSGDEGLGYAALERRLAIGGPARQQLPRLARLQRDKLLAMGYVK